MAAEPILLRSRLRKYRATSLWINRSWNRSWISVPVPALSGSGAEIWLRNLPTPQLPLTRQRPYRCLTDRVIFFYQVFDQSASGHTTVSQMVFFSFFLKVVFDQDISGHTTVCQTRFFFKRYFRLGCQWPYHCLTDWVLVLHRLHISHSSSLANALQSFSFIILVFSCFHFNDSFVLSFTWWTISFHFVEFFIRFINSKHSFEVVHKWTTHP